jgi:hypothetical protein
MNLDNNHSHLLMFSLGFLINKLDIIPYIFGIGTGIFISNNISKETMINIMNNGSNIIGSTISINNEVINKELEDTSKNDSNNTEDTNIIFQYLFNIKNRLLQEKKND